MVQWCIRLMRLIPLCEVTIRSAWSDKISNRLLGLAASNRSSSFILFFVSLPFFINCKTKSNFLGMSGKLFNIIELWAVFLQVSFQSNTATLQGSDIFMTSLELCQADKHFDNGYDFYLNDLNQSVKLATQPAYLLLNGAGCMCQKKLENTTWHLKDCTSSVELLFQ